MDYPLQQEKLVPALATTYAFFLSYIRLENFRALSLDTEAIRFELLPEVRRIVKRVEMNPMDSI